MEYWFWPILRLLAGLITVLGSGGIRAVLAENLILKQQLLVMRRSRRRAPNLRTADRFLFVGIAIATGCLNCQSPLERQFAMYTTWYVGMMRQGYDHATVGGAPDEYVIESWVGAPSRAVPETGDWTFTRSAHNFCRRFVKHKR